MDLFPEPHPNVQVRLRQGNNQRRRDARAGIGRLQKPNEAASSRIPEDFIRVTGRYRAPREEFFRRCTGGRQALPMLYSPKR